MRSARILLHACRLALALAGAPLPALVTQAAAQVPIAVSAPLAPPPLPLYAQPLLPGAGYLWTPGYWAWQGREYYWVPGCWSKPPKAGLYWTPAYWAWDDSEKDYTFFNGYWAPKVGFYGGVAYGFGYGGKGYSGGHWRGSEFVYNREANNLGAASVASDNEPVPIAESAAAYNGGDGGTQAFPTPEQLSMARERRVRRTAEQINLQEIASRIATQRFSANGGKPPIAAIRRVEDLRTGHGSAAQSGGLG